MMAVNPLRSPNAHTRVAGLHPDDTGTSGQRAALFRLPTIAKYLLSVICLCSVVAARATQLPDTEPGATEFPDIRTLLKSPPAPEATALVKVRGIVTYQHEGRSVFIQDDTGGLYAGSPTVQPLHLGDEVEVVGWVNRT